MYVYFRSVHFPLWFNHMLPRYVLDKTTGRQISLEPKSSQVSALDGQLDRQTGIALRISIKLFSRIKELYNDSSHDFPAPVPSLSLRWFAKYISLPRLKTALQHPDSLVLLPVCIVLLHLWILVVREVVLRRNLKVCWCVIFGNSTWRGFMMILWGNSYLR